MRKLNKKPRKKNMSTHQMCSSCAECSWASCASSNNSSVTRKRSAAMPKLMSATCMAGARATAAAVWTKGGGGRGLIVTAAKPRHRAHELGRIHAQQIDYLRYAYATIDAIAPDAQTSSRAV